MDFSGQRHSRLHQKQNNSQPQIHFQQSKGTFLVSYLTLSYIQGLVDYALSNLRIRTERHLSHIVHRITFTSPQQSTCPAVVLRSHMLTLWPLRRKTLQPTLMSRPPFLRMCLRFPRSELIMLTLAIAMSSSNS